MRMRALIGGACALLLAPVASADFVDNPVFRNPDAGLISLSSPFNFEPIGIALPASDPLFTNLVSNYVNLLEGTGLLDELRARWFVDAAWLDDLP